jgi:hypothetical protein
VVKVPEDVPSPLALGIGGSLGRGWVSFATAASIDDRILISKVDRRSDTDWAAAEAVRIQAEHGIPILMCATGPVADLADAIEELGGRVERVPFEEYVDACAGVYDGVRYRTVAHINHEDLNDAVEAARWHNVNDRRVFGRKESEGDIDMLEAGTLAHQYAASAGAPTVW